MAEADHTIDTMEAQLTDNDDPFRNIWKELATHYHAGGTAVQMAEVDRDQRAVIHEQKRRIESLRTDVAASIEALEGYKELLHKMIAIVPLPEQ